MLPYWAPPLGIGGCPFPFYKDKDKGTRAVTAIPKKLPNSHLVWGQGSRLGDPLFLPAYPWPSCSYQPGVKPGGCGGLQLGWPATLGGSRAR